MKLEKKKKEKETNYLTDIELRIMLCNEKIKNYKHSIEKTKKMCGWYGPSGVSGIDYSSELASSTYISIVEGFKKIERDEEKIKQLRQERDELLESKKRIRKIYRNLTGYEAQIYYQRVILRKTQCVAADEIGLSVRQLQRIEGAMRDKGII